MPKSQSAVPDATSKVRNLSTGVSRPDKGHYGRQEYLGEAENVVLACLLTKKDNGAGTRPSRQLCGRLLSQTTGRNPKPRK